MKKGTLCFVGGAGLSIFGILVELAETKGGFSVSDRGWTLLSLLITGILLLLCLAVKGSQIYANHQEFLRSKRINALVFLVIQLVNNWVCLTPCRRAQVPVLDFGIFGLMGFMMALALFVFGLVKARASAKP